MSTKRLARFLPVAGAVAVVLLGVGCSDDKDPAIVESDRREEPPDTTAPTDDGQESPEDSTEPPTEAGDDDEDAGGGSLGTGTGQHDANNGSGALVPLRIEVTSLERRGELVELGMTLTNEDEEATFDPDSVFKDKVDQPGPAYDISGVKLIDQGERMLYLPVIDSSGTCLCSNELDDITIQPGESYELHASFGGIPDSVTTLDLEVPGFAPIAGLEVQG